MKTAIPITGSTIIKVSDGFSVMLLTNDGYTVTIENDFEIKGPTPLSVVASATAEFSIDPSTLEGARVIGAQYDENGHLEISLNNGSEILVEPDEDYESWQVVGPGRYLLVCMPSGGVAIWS